TIVIPRVPALSDQSPERTRHEPPQFRHGTDVTPAPADGVRAGGDHRRDTPGKGTFRLVIAPFTPRT
ncbi:hypothetical protein, partial [Microbispora amethystogenes]|uniref:hypothetical protein n=1 Tax=Microbispora amethystogenes TaxID=1427754 RepID=UPI00195374EA